MGLSVGVCLRLRLTLSNEVGGSCQDQFIAVWFNCIGFFKAGLLLGHLTRLWENNSNWQKILNNLSSGKGEVLELAQSVFFVFCVLFFSFFFRSWTTPHQHIHTSVVVFGKQQAQTQWQMLSQPNSVISRRQKDNGRVYFCSLNADVSQCSRSVCAGSRSH